MTIIDRYIKINSHKTHTDIAKDIGVSESFVKCRALIIKDSESVILPLDVREEIHALINLINLRKEGWAVNAAKERIRQLENNKK